MPVQGFLLNDVICSYVLVFAMVTLSESVVCTPRKFSELIPELFRPVAHMLLYIIGLQNMWMWLHFSSASESQMDTLLMCLCLRSESGHEMGWDHVDGSCGRCQNLRLKPRAHKRSRKNVTPRLQPFAPPLRLSRRKRSIRARKACMFRTTSGLLHMNDVVCKRY